MDDYLDGLGNIIGNLMGNTLTNAGLSGLSTMPQNPALLYQQLIAQQQQAMPYPTLQQQLGMQNAISLPEFYNLHEIGSDLWERREWDRRFAESMKWDCQTFYDKLRSQE